MFVVLRGRLCVLVLLLASSAAAGHAQDVTEVTLKGVFLFNFARFTEWPADAHTESAVSACVLGDRAVGDALSKTVKGKQVAGRPITVTVVDPEGSMRTCHVFTLCSVSYFLSVVSLERHGRSDLSQ
jgi:YfiR/HmsC-like